MIFDRKSNTLIVKSHAVIESGIKVNSGVILGRNVNIWGGIITSGDIISGRGCNFRGDIEGRNVIIGAHSILRNIIASEDVKLLDYCRAGKLKAGKDVYLRRGVFVEGVEAEGNIIVDGNVRIGEYRAGKKVIAIRT